MSEDNPQLEAWLAYMAKRYPNARDLRCYHCKLPYAVYSDHWHGELVSVHKRCPSFERRGKQPPIGLRYQDLLKQYLRGHCADRSVAVIHSHQIEGHFDEFYALLKKAGVDDLSLLDDIILIEMDPEEMVEFVNNFPQKYCYVEGWENGQCVTENT